MHADGKENFQKPSQMAWHHNVAIFHLQKSQYDDPENGAIEEEI